jgi:hypothetical protein
VARIVPDNAKVCTGTDLAIAVESGKLSREEARAWHRDLDAARSHLKPLADKWR